jgi:hypothetical protein
MSKAKFKAGQVVRFPSCNTVGMRARKGGTILSTKPMYELKEENKRYYPNGKCKGDLTTFVGLSNGNISSTIPVLEIIKDIHMKLKLFNLKDLEVKN